MRKFPAYVVLSSVFGCAAQPPPSSAPLSPPTTPVASAPALPSAAPVTAASAVPSAPIAGAAPSAPAPPSDAQKTDEGRQKAEADHRLELSRWTPELRAQAKRLAETRYDSTDAALKAVLASPHRKPGNADRDKYRHPRETLAFFGLKPTFAVLEYGPGNGWYSELLAPALATRGKLFVTSEDVRPEAGPRSVYAYRLQLLLETSPELYGKVQKVVIDPKQPKLGLDGQLDLVLVIRELHNLVSDGVLAANLSEFSRALKPGGVLGIVDHRARADAEPLAAAKLGYLPEAWTIQQVEAAGFHLSAKSEVNANPKDTKDYPDGVWTLPPTYRLGAKDREKYAAIGESDRFTLRFVKSAGTTAPKREAQ